MGVVCKSGKRKVDRGYIRRRCGIVYRDGLNQPDLLIKTIKLRQNEYYGFSVYCYGNPFNGFGTFELKEDRQGKTLVTYQLYLHNIPPPPQNATDEEMRELALEADREQVADKTRKLGNLKALVEKASKK